MLSNEQFTAEIEKILEEKSIDAEELDRLRQLLERSK